MRAFRPGVLPSLVVLLLLPLLLSLGGWQLQRADEKSVLLAHQEARRHAPAQAISDLEQSADLAFRRVLLRGYFDAEHSVLLDNRTRDGRVGVELLQPFYDQPSGLWLLLNRGWLPWPDRRTPVAFSTPSGALQLQAWIYVAPGETFQLQADQPGNSWPQLMTRIDTHGLWQQLGRAGWPFELRLLPGPAAYQARWAVVAMGPEKHLGYAVQWFAMALALACLFIYFGIRNAKEQSDAVCQSR